MYVYIHMSSYACVCMCIRKGRDDVRGLEISSYFSPNPIHITPHSNTLLYRLSVLANFFKDENRLRLERELLPSTKKSIRR